MKRLLLLLSLASGAWAQTLVSGGAAVNITQIGGTNVVTGGVNGSLGVGGLAAVGATVAGSPVYMGGVFNTSPATITTGQAGALQLDATQNLLTKINAAIPAGSNVIGHVIADSGSTTVVTGTVAVTESGTWTVQPGNTANTTAWLVKPVTTCTSAGAFSVAMVALTTSFVSATGTTTCLEAIYFSNQANSSATVSIEDGTGSPVIWFGGNADFTIPANSAVTIPLYGIPTTTGFKWKASATTVVAGAFGYQ